MTDHSAGTVTAFGSAPILVFADHASNRVPEPLGDLGLSAAALNTHIAWDIGAAELARRLAQQLFGKLVLCEFSRLLIDPNRDPAQSDSIPLRSDGQEIPANKGLSVAQKEQRIQQWFAPYHQLLDTQACKLAENENAFGVSIHSFTQRMQGAAESRPWHIGLLWNHDQASATAAMAWLNDNTQWRVGDNLPYDGRYYNYSADRHFAQRSIPHITLEIRQDLLMSNDGIACMAGDLASMITAVSAACSRPNAVGERV